MHRRFGVERNGFIECLSRTGSSFRYCHPERSEGSVYTHVDVFRSFTSLRSVQDDTKGSLLDESVSSKQAEGLRKAEDGFRAIRDVLLRTPSEKIRALKHVPLKNTITNKLQNKNRRFPMKKTAVYGWENGGL